MKQQNHSVMLADNFPSKAYLLISHLTEKDPEVSSFSADGASFEIYDQSIFAQEYLPQYFKHSNYGSFVRQLNLYGFTSSRLKKNNDVVVWTHDYFHRDRKDLVKEITRTKKTKSSKKPSHVHINNNKPRSPSPPSVSDDISSDNPSTPAIISKGSGSGLDHGWLESEFASLKQQNNFLEQKLDTLLTLTLRISQVSLDEIQLGGKRRRVTSSPIESSRYDHSEQLESIYEEQKLFHEDDYVGESKSNEGDVKSPPEAAYEESMKENRVVFSAPGGKGVSYANHVDAVADQEFVVKEDSLKRFVDIMLNEDEENEDEECIVREEANNIYSRGSPKSHAAAVAKMTNTEYNDTASYPPEPEGLSVDILDDELMEEAMNAMMPGGTIDTDGDLFAPPDSVERVQSNGDRSNEYQPPIFAGANHLIDKADGPEPIRAVSPEVPTLQDGDLGDLEEGNMPVGVAVVAEAEVVEDSTPHIEALQEQDRQHVQRHRRRILCLIAFIGAALVALVAVPSVLLTNSSNEEKRPLGKLYSSDDRPGKGKGKGKGQGGGGGGKGPGNHNLEAGTVEGDDNNDDEFGNSEDATKVFRSFSDMKHHMGRRKRGNSLFGDEDGGINSFSLNLKGTGYVCSIQL